MCRCRPAKGMGYQAPECKSAKAKTNLPQRIVYYVGHSGRVEEMLIHTSMFSTLMADSSGM